MELEQLVFVRHQVNMMQIDTMQNNDFLQQKNRQDIMAILQNFKSIRWRE